MYCVDCLSFLGKKVYFKSVFKYNLNFKYILKERSWLWCRFMFCWMSVVYMYNFCYVYVDGSKMIYVFININFRWNNWYMYYDRL